MWKRNDINNLPTNEEMPEDLLWISFIQGNDSSFELIYKKYIKALFHYGIQFTSDEEMVKDAIHDMFIRLYNSRSQLKKEVHIKFYLFTALKNSLYNMFKREMFFEKIEEKEALEILDKTAESKVASGLEEEGNKQIVINLLSLLTDRQREVIYYRFVEELSLEEIGVLMDMNKQSVQNLIQRSLKKMRNTSAMSLLFTQFIYRTLSFV